MIKRDCKCKTCKQRNKRDWAAIMLANFTSHEIVELAELAASPIYCNPYVVK